MTAGNVRSNSPRTKQDVSRAVAEAWFRLQREIGKGTLADAIGVSSPKTVENAIAQRSLPEAHFIFNGLCADPTALNEVLALYGFQAVPVRGQVANDMVTITGLSHLVAEWLERLADGLRCHRDTKALANRVRPHLLALIALVEEADGMEQAA